MHKAGSFPKSLVAPPAVALGQGAVDLGVEGIDFDVGDLGPFPFCAECRPESPALEPAGAILGEVPIDFACALRDEGSA